MSIFFFETLREAWMYSIDAGPDAKSSHMSNCGLCRLFSGFDRYSEIRYG
jgi:hypothetical protein